MFYLVIKIFKYLEGISPILNIWNIINFPKLFFVINNPFNYIFYFLNPQKKNLTISINSPIGKFRLKIRNRKTARVFYSLFIREDYKITNNAQNIIDIGSNIGISALYFLSRNHLNKIISIEPDPNNIIFLRKNLEQSKFQDRYKIIEKAIDDEAGNQKLSIVENGVNTSLIKRQRNLLKIIDIEVITFDELIQNCSFFDPKLYLVLKIDIEGAEERVLRSINFRKYNSIRKIILEKREINLEKKGYESLLNKKVIYKERNGFITIIKFQS